MTGKTGQDQGRRLAAIKRYAESRNFAGKKDLKRALPVFIGKDEYLVVGDGS